MPPLLDPQLHTAFFYGTLMAPSVLTRVTGPSRHRTSTVSRPHPPIFQPAVLPHHRRRRVKNADYPAVTPSPTSSVRGTLVSNLTDTDLERLDIFEGSEYERRSVRVKLLSGKVEEGGGVAEPLAYGGIMPTEESRGQGEWVEAQTYIWIAPEEELEDAEWDFDMFRREKLHLWDGGNVEDEGMREVDQKFGQGDGTRGRSFQGGEFERAVVEREVA